MIENSMILLILSFFIFAGVIWWCAEKFISTMKVDSCEYDNLNLEEKQ